MRLEHIAIWTNDLEKVKNFYVDYFGMKCNEKYENKTKQFSSYFLSFDGQATKIELMHRADVSDGESNRATSFGLTHFSISVGNKEKVNMLTERLRADGYKIVGEPRTTGDGFYESVVEDCEGNQIEISESEKTQICEAEIEVMEHKLVEAIKTSDLEFLDSVMDDNLLGIAPNGLIITKEMDMTSHREKTMIVEKVITHIDKIQVFGDTALVITTYETKGKMLGTPIEGKFRYNRVWKKINNQLKIITVGCVMIL